MSCYPVQLFLFLNYVLGETVEFLKHLADELQLPCQVVEVKDHVWQLLKRFLSCLQLDVRLLQGLLHMLCLPVLVTHYKMHPTLY